MKNTFYNFGERHSGIKSAYSYGEMWQNHRFGVPISIIALFMILIPVFI